jgi:large subunit ribosomal protein L24
MRIKKGDNVQVIAGKDKGKTGTVERALPRDNTVIVEGVNVRKRHRRPRRMGQQGQIVEVNQPIDVSNVMIIDPKTNEPTRVGMHVKEDGSKVRVTKKSGTELS